ncbi:hypothetical protein QZH41_016260, partial [Actinostola sp. cb2023]
LLLGYTKEADEVFKNSRDKPSGMSEKLEEVRKQAIEAVRKRNGDVINELDVQGEYLLQFGRYRGQNFRWMLENALGYVGWFVDNIRSEKATHSPISQNKAAFKEYVVSFKEGREVALKQQQREEKEAKLKASKPVSQSSTPKPAVSPLAHGLASGQISTEKYLSRFSTSAGPSRFKPTIPPQTRCRKPVRPSATITATCTQTSADDQELCAIAEQIEKNLEHPLLPEGWRKTLPKADHQWVSLALFTVNKRGKAKLDWDRVNKLWWDPPQPPLITTQPPRPDRYYAQRLLLWMPRKLWKVTLYCPHPGCDNQRLTSAGLYNTVRQVVDIDSCYNLAAEYLECKNCKRKVISWSPAIVKQLDMGHQLQFPVLLTYQYACDIRVIRLLRQRGLGNSSTQLQKKLTEEHSEKYMQRTAQYLTECKYFATASRSGLIGTIDIQEPPQFVPVPKYRWLLTVYAQDIMARIDYIKASITSICGRVLKMDSTKKIVKKLAGSSAGTASWATNVGNERGQVLMSVLTVNEGAGLEIMANGLMRRYSMADVPTPEALYVDRDCCSGTTVQTKQLFSLWENLVIRLDIWHFMRRFAAGCNTESHPLYSVFLCRLSQCIFQWSNEDLSLLKSAKKSQLQKQGIKDPSDAVIIEHTNRKEFALHCRRKTRGIVQTATMIYDLLMTFTGPQGCDSTGVPLLDNERMWEIWDSQQRHIECIQDPEGTSASDMHFQAYLLEGLQRWNADRATNAVANAVSGPESYSGVLCQVVNELSEDVLGKAIRPDVQKVGIYTGERIGVEYLYNQTGEVLSENTLEDEDVQAPGEELLSDLNPDQLDEGFVETEDETIAGAEQVFTVPEGSEKGKGNAYFLIRGIPEVRFQGIPFPASLRGVQTEKNERLLIASMTNHIHGIAQNGPITSMGFNQSHPWDSTNHIHGIAQNGPITSMGLLKMGQSHPWDSSNHIHGIAKNGPITSMGLLKMNQSHPWDFDL